MKTRYPSEPHEKFNAGRVMQASVSKSADGPRVDVELSDRARAVASQFAQNVISPFVLASVVRLIEMICIFTIGVAVYLAYVVPQDGHQPFYIATSLVGAFLSVIALQAADSYQISALRTHVTQFGRVLLAWTAVFALLALVAFFSRVSLEYSRVWFGGWFLAGIVFFVVFRSFMATLVRRWAIDGRLERRAVIVGGGDNATSLIKSLDAQADNDIRICGIFDDRSSERSPAMVAGYPKLGTVAELIEFGRQARIDMLIVSLPLTAEDRVLSLLQKVWVLPVDIRLSAHTNKLRFRPRSYSYVGTVPFLDIFDKPIADWDSIIKRGFDIFFSALSLILLSPLMILTALAIRLETPGPILFRQKRFGFNNEVVDVLKFRSMYADKTDAEAKQVVTKNDPRVTRVGRFIRKSSIDELPQLWNVLKGELSLVGPRPHAVYAHTKNKLWDEVVEGYFGRHKVKPGVTGWAQVNGWRGEVDSDQKIRRRVEHDLYYIENWSVLFDLYILVITPFKLFNTEQAY